MSSKNETSKPVPPGWERLIIEWEADLADRGRRPATIESYGAAARRLGVWTGASTLPQVVDAARLRRWVRDQREAGIGSRSITQRLSALRSFYDFLHREELMPSNPARALENPKFRKPLPEILRDYELMLLLSLPLRDTEPTETRWRDAALLRTLVWGGLRSGEVAALKWDHVDFSPDVRTLTVIDGKGGRDRVVPMAGPLGYALSKYLDYRLPLTAQRAVFISTRGNPLTTRRIGEIVSGYGRRMGKRVHPHLLRSQCGVEMLRRGASLAHVRAVLGHVGYDTLVPYTTLAAVEARPSVDIMADKGDPGFPSVWGGKAKPW